MAFSSRGSRDGSVRFLGTLGTPIASLPGACLGEKLCTKSRFSPVKKLSFSKYKWLNFEASGVKPADIDSSVIRKAWIFPRTTGSLMDGRVPSCRRDCLTAAGLITFLLALYVDPAVAGASRDRAKPACC